MLSERGAEVWDTAVHYHLIHALALCVAGLVSRDGPRSSIRLAGWAFGLGMVLFSGSLYLLALDGPRFLGPVTPLGGVCFIVGWIALAVNAFSRQSP